MSLEQVGTSCLACPDPGSALSLTRTVASWADKASRFAASCSRHGGEAGAVVQVRITFTNPKYVRFNDNTWQAEGFDACRADRTSASANPEWCLKSPSQVVVQEIRKIQCGDDLPAFEGEAISLGSVRRLATRIGLAEVSFDEQHGVVSFAADVNACNSARIDVYFLTGTVCSVYQHPRQGTMRAVRRKADLSSLEQLFRELFSGSSGSCSCHGPSAGSKRTASGDCSCDGRNDGVKKPRQSLCAGEEDEVKATLDKLREEVKEAEAVLEDHRRKREEEERRAAAAEQRRKEEQAAAEAARLAAAAEQRRKQEQAAAEAARLAQAAAQAAALAAAQAKMESRGIYASAWLSYPEDYNNMMRKDVRCVATNGDSTVCLYDDGDWAYTAGLPTLLHNKLNGRALHHPSPTYVALGTMGRYYIEFASGKSEWVGCDHMNDLLKHPQNRSVRTVAFGEDWDSYFVVFDDGWWSCNNVAQGLLDLIKTRRNASDLSAVSLGPTGEWFLQAQNGRTWWGACAHVVDETDDIQNQGGDIKFIDFGSDNSYIIRWS